MPLSRVLLGRFGPVCCLATLVAATAFAQDPPPEQPAELPPGETAAETEPAQPMTGDIITFKNGAVWGNVQVLRSTPRYHEIEQFPGLPPVQISPSLVESIQYDNIDPAREKLIRDLMPQPESPTVVSADQLSPEFREKLTAAFTQTPQVFTNQMIGQVMNKLSELAGVPIEVDASVRELPADQKQWTVTFQPGTTLLNVLQDELPKAFPTFRAMFEFDKVKVMTAARMTELETESAATQTPPN